MVTTTSSDDADTILVTFDDPLGGTAACANLVQWGIDYWDPVATDTPQGNGFFVPSSEYGANLPSGLMYALGGQATPAKSFIEFDPPVVSAEFYFSRQDGASAYWNGIKQNVESMPVYARSRTPGTLIYQQYDQKTLHANVPTAIGTHVVYNAWTPVKLQSLLGDKIQWLWFDGTVAIDNLKIVRTGLSCSPSTVVRGQTVTCVVQNPTYSVTKWEFREDGGGG